MPASYTNGYHQPDIRNDIASDDIVITGFSGRFPESSSVEEFSWNLYNGIDMVNEDERRWPKGFHGLPARTGKLKEDDLENFDNQFFGVHQKLASCMDPQLRMLLESSYEAIIDAGINPQDLRGTRTGVYVGVCNTDIEHDWCHRPDNSNGYEFIGSLRSMLANRISYTFHFTGPSFAIDSACSSSLHAVAQAYWDIKTGRCDAAIACGANLALHPFISERLLKLGVLGPTGHCRSFDKNCDGYCRSEACVSIFLQKESNSKRIYAKVLNAQVSNDGYKEHGITYPNGITQRHIMKETCDQINLNPLEVSYIEAHGPGTLLGDTQEMSGVTEFFCKDRKEPLLIGSVKSNMGHGEGAAGVCSIVKVLLAMEKGEIAGNLHFNEPNLHIGGLINGQLKVVEKNTPWKGGIASISSFGLGGANANILLKSNQKSKRIQSFRKIPYLVCVSGRTSDAVQKLLENLELHKDDEEYLGLVNQIHTKSIPLHYYRGYTVIGENQYVQREIINISEENRQVWFIYSGMGSQWGSMGKELMKIDVCNQSLQRSAKILLPKGIDLMDILLNSDDSIFTEVMNSFVALSAMQIALTDLLCHIGIQPDGIIGQSMGELAAGYADKCLTLEQAILGNYFRGKSVTETELIHGVMASVGLSWDECKKRLPSDIFPVIFNAVDNITISGPNESVHKFVNDLKNEGIFAKIVNVGRYAFHSKYIGATVPKLHAWLKNLIPHPKKRSTKWISSSVPENQWQTPLAEMCSPEYYINNWISPVLFHQALQHIPHNAICIEIAPHGFLQGIIRQTIGKEALSVSLMQRHSDKNIPFLFRNIGILYGNGRQPDITKLYHPITYPVGRGTPMLNSSIGWDHSQKFKVPKLGINSLSHHHSVNVDLSNEKYSHWSGHKVNGRIILPATGYLSIIWKIFAKSKNISHDKLPVIFENVQFHEVIFLQSNDTIKLQFQFLHKSNKFELCNNDTLVVSGQISSPNELAIDIQQNQQISEACLESTDIYTELRIRGYDYEDNFVGILKSNMNFDKAFVQWKNSWTSFMDSMLQISLLSGTSNDLLLPITLNKVIIDPIGHNELITNMGDNMYLTYNKISKIIKCGGIQIHGIRLIQSPTMNRIKDIPTLEEYKFVPLLNDAYDEDVALNVLTHLAAENLQGALKVSVLDSVENINSTENLGIKIKSIIEKEPILIGDLTILVQQQIEDDGITEFNDPTVRIVSKNELTDDQFHIVIDYNVLSAPNAAIKLRNMKNQLSTNGFILIKQSKQNHNEVTLKNLCAELSLIIISEQSSVNNSYILLRVETNILERKKIIVNITERSMNWLSDLKAAITLAKTEKYFVYLISQEEEQFGAMGLMNCIKKEEGGQLIRLFSIENSATNEFSFCNECYSEQLKKDLVINIQKNNKWGTYRHINIHPQRLSPVDEVELQTVNSGEYSSLQFVEISKKITEMDHNDEVTVFCASVNKNDVITNRTKTNHTKFGIEFSGKNQYGERIMGLTPFGCICTTTQSVQYLTWKMPDKWTMAEAATIPAAYVKAYYALKIRGRIEKDQTILINGSLEDVALATISICLHDLMKFLIVVNTIEEQNKLSELFPNLLEENFILLNNYTEKDYYKEVDLLLNCGGNIKENDLLRFLSPHGTFIQIGKSGWNEFPFIENLTVHFINLEKILQNDCKSLKIIKDLMAKGIECGQVKPFPAIIYDHDNVKQAFDRVYHHNNYKKIVIQMKNETCETINKHIMAIPKTHIKKDKSYVIIGGLGAFGLELCKWLVTEGARKLVIVSRSGVNSNYKLLILQMLKQSGATVIVLTDNIATLKGAEKVLTESEKIGPVGGIFNLAVVVRDNLIQDQTEEDFHEVCAAKINGTKNIDELSRRLCSSIDYFVCFSSVSCGRGSAGQANYGLANSTMERICEHRHSLGLPALAIQWGSIADAGLYYRLNKNNYKTFIGTQPQRMKSCLQTMDYFLRQTKYPVLSSFVLATKLTSNVAVKLSKVECVAQILGIRDIKNIPEQLTLMELGVDSLMVTEIRQTLEKYYNLMIDPDSIRQLTFAKLKSYGDV